MATDYLITIDQEQFKGFRKKCPLFFRKKEEPMCSALEPKLKITNTKRHCAISNCFALYWLAKYKEAEI